MLHPVDRPTSKNRQKSDLGYKACCFGDHLLNRLTLIGCYVPNCTHMHVYRLMWDEVKELGSEIDTCASIAILCLKLSLATEIVTRERFGNNEHSRGCFRNWMSKKWVTVSLFRRRGSQGLIVELGHPFVTDYENEDYWSGGPLHLNIHLILWLLSHDIFRNQCGYFVDHFPTQFFNFWKIRNNTFFKKNKNILEHIIN